jgi:hypothetical protein
MAVMVIDDDSRAAQRLAVQADRVGYVSGRERFGRRHGWPVVPMLMPHYQRCGLASATPGSYKQRPLCPHVKELTADSTVEAKTAAKVGIAVPVVCWSTHAPRHRYPVAGSRCSHRRPSRARFLLSS